MALNNILSILDDVSAFYKNGYGKKESNLYKFLKEHKIIHSFVKDQGFIIPSLNRPKKVVFVSMAHPDSFNYSFKSNMRYNLLKHSGETFIKGGLLNTINISIVLDFIINYKEVLNDTIFVFTASNLNDSSPINNFIKSINKDLRKELVFFNIDLSEEKNISNDALIRTYKEYAPNFFNYLNEKYKDYNFDIKEEKRTTNFLKAIFNNGVIGCNISLPVLNQLHLFGAMTSLFSVERFSIVLKFLLLDNYNNVNIEKDISISAVEKRLKEKNESKNKTNISQLIDNIYMTISDLKLKIKNEEFLMKYLKTKYETNSFIYLNYLEQKIGQRKELKTLLDTLFDYGVVAQVNDDYYQFNK